MSRYTNLSLKEIEEYIANLEDELMTCNHQRMQQIDSEITAANEAIMAGDYNHSRDVDYRSQRDQRGGWVNNLGGFNPLNTYFGQPQTQLRVLGTYQIGNGTLNNNNGIVENGDLRASAEYRTAFFNYVMGREVTPEQRALVTTTTGAAIIPTSMHNEIIANVQKAQGLINRVRVLDLPGNLTIPTSDINTPASWHTQGEEISDSNLPPDSITLTGYELAKLFSLSVATQTMSIASFESYLIAELTRCSRDALAGAIFTGTGSGQPTGIIQGITWNASNSVEISTDAWSALGAAMALLPANYRQNAAWVMNSVMFYNYIATQLDANGNPIFAKDLSSGLPFSLMGKPIILDDFCPDNTIVFGDPAYYFLNFSQPISVERSREAGFTKGTVIYRSLAVVDGAPVAPAFVKVTKAAA